MFAGTLRHQRKAQEFSLRDLATKSGIDQTLLSRFEHGDRLPTQEQFDALAKTLKGDVHALRIQWMAEKVLKVLAYDQNALEALKVAESRVAHLVSQNALRNPEIPADLQAKLDELIHLRQMWQSRLPLGSSHEARINEALDVAYTFESNRIEGNTLTLHETAMVVGQGLTIGGKSLREHLEAINHIDAIDFVRGILARKEDVSKRVILDIHRLILKGVDTENAGVYRIVPVRISGSDVELPQPFLIDQLMDEYFRYYEMHQRRLHPVLLAADMHERLVSIHPFIDGNGRTARLVMNLILLRNGYTRANIKGSNESRLAYYRALEQVQKDNNPYPFYHLVADECIVSLQEHLALT
jgi:Fic family protein